MTTGPATAVGSTGATLSGSYAGATGTVTETGFYWGTSSGSLDNELYADSGSGASGDFSKVLTSLSPSTTYYYKAYVLEYNESTLSYEYRYGSVRFFTTTATPTPSGYAWMELPEMSPLDEGTFYAHDLTGAEYVKKATSGHRNWSCYWSVTHKVSYWVAYPMFDEVNARNVSRVDAFGYDPIVPSSQQPNIGSNTYQDAGGHSYSRGHQIPSSDRLSSAAANRTTFYATNMTPQMQSFNGGIWKNLEDAVQGWAAGSDTLYVVTGCIINGGCIQTTDKSGSATVTVPSHYYKALLRVKNGTYTSCAFYLDHFGSYAGGGTNYEVGRKTVAQLEALTGINFFVNLPDRVGSSTAATIEGTSTVW